MREGFVLMKKELLQFIIERILNSAKDSLKDLNDDKSEFNDGKTVAYYEVLDILKNELWAHGYNLDEYNLEIDLEKLFFCNKNPGIFDGFKDLDFLDYGLPVVSGSYEEYFKEGTQEMNIK